MAPLAEWPTDGALLLCAVFTGCNFHFAAGSRLKSLSNNENGKNFGLGN